MQNDAETPHPVYAKLRSAIMTGDLEPGSMLRANQIADDLGTSTVPVREALLRLSERGLVRYRHNHGFEVAHYDPVEQIEFIKIAMLLYERSVPGIFDAPNAERKVVAYREFVEAQMENDLSSEELQHRCVSAFTRLLLSRPTNLLLSRLYDVSHEGRAALAPPDRAKLDKFILEGVRHLEEGNPHEVLSIILAAFENRISTILSRITP